MLKGMKEYWKRRGRGYRRLNGSGGRRRKRVEVELGTGRRRRRFWRIKISPKIRLARIPSPKKLLIWLRDSYVRMMMGLANSRVMMSLNVGAAVGYGASAGDAMAMAAFGLGKTPLKEYDDKMIIQIYNSLMMQQPHRRPQSSINTT